MAKQLAAYQLEAKLALEECNAAGGNFSSPACAGPQSFRALSYKAEQEGFAMEDAGSELAASSRNLNKAMGIPNSGSGSDTALVVGGIVAGVVSVVTGGVALLPDIGDFATSALTYTSLLSGAASTAVDAQACLSGSRAEACAGMGFGIASALSGVAGFILDQSTEKAADAAQALGTAERGLSLTGLVDKVSDSYAAFFGLDSVIADSAEAYVDQH